MLTSLLAAKACEIARAQYGESDNFLKVSTFDSYVYALSFECHTDMGIPGPEIMY